MIDKEIAQAMIGAAAVVLSGAVAAGAAIASSILTARQMKSVTERQIEGASQTERARYLRDMREARVAGLRSLLSELRDAIANALKILQIEAGANSDVITQLIEQRAANYDEPISPERIADIRRRLGEQWRADENVGEPSLVIVQILGRIQAHTPPSGGIRDRLRDLHAQWSDPMIAAGRLYFGKESLAVLVIHADAIEHAIDEFVVDG